MELCPLRRGIGGSRDALLLLFSDASLGVRECRPLVLDELDLDRGDDDE